jgi:sirohydrochlorin ferrochelatase
MPDSAHADRAMAPAAAVSSAGVDLVTIVFEDAEAASRHVDRWVSVQLLAMGAVLLPCVGETLPILTVDVHRALYDSALALGVCDGRRGAHEFADAAQVMLAEHLVDSYLAVPDEYGRWSLRYWLTMTPMSTAVAELQAAAWFNRLVLLTEELGAEGLRAYLAAQERAGRKWVGAAEITRQHPFGMFGALARLRG